MAIWRFACNRRGPILQKATISDAKAATPPPQTQALHNSECVVDSLDECADDIVSHSLLDRVCLVGSHEVDIKGEENIQRAEGDSVVDGDLFEIGFSLGVDSAEDEIPKAALDGELPAYLSDNAYMMVDNVTDIMEDSHLHLFILVHGIVGSPHDFDFWEEMMRQRGHDNWRIMKVESITGPLSFPQQINPWRDMKLQDVASHLVDEVVPWVESFAQAREKLHLHFVCHSLGGLLVRTAMPTLCERLDKIRTCSLEFGHLLTLNSPHIGIQAKRKRYRWKHLVRFKDLHKQVTLRDSEGFLQRLADPADEFLPLLARFRYRTAVGATHWDLIVPFCTSLICSKNPFRRPVAPSFFGSSFCRWDAATGFEIDKTPQARLLERGPSEPAEKWREHVTELENGTPGPASEIWSASDDGSVVFPPEMLTNLASACWRRVAFTLHWTGVNPHTFPIGRTQCEWSQQLVESLIDVLEEAL